MPQELAELGKSRRRIILCGLGSCVTYSVITWFSFQFVYGQNHQQRPILPFLGCYGVAFLLYCLAWREVRFLWQATPSCVHIVMGFALCFRAIVLLSQPIQEDDFYRYLWDGKVVASGLNPYAVSPQQVKEARLDDVLIQPYVHIAQQEPEFILILARVNHPTVLTIYPPLAQGLFGLTALVVPGSLLALRLALLGFDVALCWLVVTLLRDLDINPVFVVLYAWSPLVIKETVNSAHYDVMPTWWLMLALLLSLRRKGILAHASFAFAILGKVYPLILLPLLTIRTWRTQGSRQALTGLALMVVLVFCGYALFWQAGVSLWQGTLTFATRWQTNSFLFPLLHMLIAERWMANAVVALLLAGIVIGILIRRDMGDSHQFLWSVFLILGAVFLLSPVGNPWYFLWIVPLLCVFPLRSWLLFSGLLGLYYGYFSLSYRHQGEYFRWVMWLEYVPFYTMLVWDKLKAVGKDKRGNR